MKQVFTVPFENEPAFLKKILSAAGQAGIQTGPSARWEPFRQAVKILLPFFNSFGGSCVGLRDEPSNRFCLRLTAQFLPLSPSCVFYLPEGDSLLAVTARCIGRAEQNSALEQAAAVWKTVLCISGCWREAGTSGRWTTIGYATLTASIPKTSMNCLIFVPPLKNKRLMTSVSLTTTTNWKWNLFLPFDRFVHGVFTTQT